MLKLSIIGNLGADCRKNEGNFSSFYSFSLAHSVKRSDDKGQLYEQTLWINCIINWDCSKVFPYLRGGTKVYVHGNGSLKITTNDNGDKFASLTCVVSDLELCGGPKPNTSIPQQDDDTNNQLQPETSIPRQDDDTNHPLQDTNNPLLHWY